MTSRLLRIRLCSPAVPTGYPMRNGENWSQVLRYNESERRFRKSDIGVNGRLSDGGNCID
jgi:hypothetical protein